MREMIDDIHYKVPRSTMRWLEWALFLAGAIFVALIFVEHRFEISSSLSTTGLSVICAAVLLALPMHFVKAIYNAKLICSLANQHEIKLALLNAYASSQLVRYVPGKIWGIVYQSIRVRDSYDAGVVAIGNVIQYLYTNFFSLFIITAIVVLTIAGPWLALAVVTMGCLLTYILHTKPLLNSRFIVWIVSKLSRKKMPGNFLSVRYAVILLLVDWAFYLAIWRVIVPAGHSWTETMVIAALYASASLLSVFAALAPGGLIVREALFIALGTWLSVSEPLLLALGIVSRLVLTLSEIMFAVIMKFSESTVRYIRREK